MLKNFITKHASGKWVAILALIFIAFNALVFPNVLPADVEPLDLQPFYTAHGAYTIIATYSPEILHNYMLAEVSLDVIYPLIYSTLFAFIIFLLFKNATLAQVPFLIFLADLAENTGIVLLLYNYPERLNTLATITGFLTTLKWSLVAAVVVLILVGLAKKLFLKKG